MKLSLFAAALCLTASTSIAAELAPADFAYGMPLTVDGNAAIYKLSLPNEVYRHAVRGDLGDLRVFNADGEAVPYSLSAQVAQLKVSQPPVALPIFPLRGDPARALDAVRITIAAGNARVDLHAPASVQQPAQIVAYVIDARAFDSALAALELHWPETAGEFSGRVEVSASDDLGSWRPIAGGLPVANLSFAGRQLIQSRVEFPASRAKFFLLSWQGNSAPFALTEVMAVPADTQADAVRSQLEVAGHPEVDAPDSYDFDLQSHPPVDRVDLRSPQPNTFVQVILSSRDRLEAPWRVVANASIYELQSDGQTIRSKPVRLGVDTDRYWRLQVQPAGGIGRDNPTLRFGWIPHEIVFVARGPGPFQLAFGNFKAASAQSSLREFFTDQKSQVRIGSVAAGALRELGGPARLTAERELPWKKWLLWTALIIAVALLAFLAYRLSREMSKQA